MNLGIGVEKRTIKCIAISTFTYFSFASVFVDNNAPRQATLEYNYVNMYLMNPLFGFVKTTPKTNISTFLYNIVLCTQTGVFECVFAALHSYVHNLTYII